MKTKQFLLNAWAYLMTGIAIAILFSSCATIVGGAKYNAHINVKNNKDARIIYNGRDVGQGYTVVQVPRAQANRFTVRVREDGCSEQEFNFTSRSFRGWSLVGTIVTWTGLVNGVPLPWGVVVDAATGAWFKPNVMENNVMKMDYDNFSYIIDYKGCEQPMITNKPVTSDNLTDEEKRVMLKVLLKQGKISQEEYDREIGRLKDK